MELPITKSDIYDLRHLKVKIIKKCLLISFKYNFRGRNYDIKGIVVDDKILERKPGVVQEPLSETKNNKNKRPLSTYYENQPWFE